MKTDIKQRIFITQSSSKLSSQHLNTCRTHLCVCFHKQEKYLSTSKGTCQQPCPSLCAGWLLLSEAAAPEKLILLYFCGTFVTTINKGPKNYFRSFTRQSQQWSAIFPLCCTCIVQWDLLTKNKMWCRIPAFIQLNALPLKRTSTLLRASSTTTKRSSPS